MTMLDRLRELEAKATKGPLAVQLRKGPREVLLLRDHYELGSLANTRGIGIVFGADGDDGGEANARYIESGMNALPLLLRVAEAADAWERAVDASDAELERTEKALDAAVRALRSEP